MEVLLSIHPEHVEKILSGVKIFEFRRRIPKLACTHLLIYATRPVSKIVARARITKIHTANPSDIWDLTSAGAGISQEFFDSYFHGRSEAHALELNDVQVFDPPIDPYLLPCGFTPPQGHLYVPPGIYGN